MTRTLTKDTAEKHLMVLNGEVPDASLDTVNDALQFADRARRYVCGKLPEGLRASQIALDSMGDGVRIDDIVCYASSDGATQGALRRARAVMITYGKLMGDLE